MPGLSARPVPYGKTAEALGFLARFRLYGAVSVALRHARAGGAGSEVLFVAHAVCPSAREARARSREMRAQSSAGMKAAIAVRCLVTHSYSEDSVMLYWAAVFFVIALLAAIFGFGGLAASAAGVAKILFFVFLVFALVSFLFGRRSAA